MPSATRLMTSTARSLGAMDTVVANTSGLDAKGQVSSVYDLAVFGRALLRDPALAAVVRTKTYPFPRGGTAVSRGSRRTYQIQNHNLLLFRYPGATGIKNGYTTAASASFVGSATRGGHSYVVALLRTETDSWRLAAALLDWAFSHGSQAAPIGVLGAAGSSAGPSPGASPGVAGAAPSPGSTGGITSAIAGPMAATLQTVPSGSRTIYLVAAFVVAVVGGALVRGLAMRWPEGRRRPSVGRRKVTRPAGSKGPGSRGRGGPSPSGRRPSTSATARRGPH
jgi:D-alanyl-D-alanine carboxypeptidase (penicillin-binding protein 5/6)